MAILLQGFTSLQVILLCRAMQTALVRDLPVEENALATIASIVAIAKGEPVSDVVQYLAPRCTLVPPITT